MRILSEASGSLTSGYIQKKIVEAGHVSIGSDINPLNCSLCLSDEFVEVPPSNDEQLWDKMEKILKQKQIDVVIPSLDETLMGWAERKNFFKKNGVFVVISDPDTIQRFQDKWLTYKTFMDNELPTPKTSLQQIYQLVKPRFGRGSEGILINAKPKTMEGNVSQEIIEGEEYTVDCFYDYENNPVYIIPRKRIDVKDGKSTKGEVVKNASIVDYIKKFSKKIKFIGPINYQCFITSENIIKFIEINPRIAGGMALGIESSENWFSLIVDNLILKKKIEPVNINYGLKMIRYYAECFVS